eukprot:25933-Pyramimonas_sp.AAC.1
MHVRPHGPSAELPMRPRGAGVSAGSHSSAATGAFCGAPYGAAKRCPGSDVRMLLQPPEPSVEPIYGAT